jgi:aspartate kinase
VSRPLVYKFGGTSVADAARISEVARLVDAAPTPPLVVVSALSKVTDQLLRAATYLQETGNIDGESVSALRERHQGVLRELAASDEERARVGAELEQIFERLRRAQPDSGGPAEVVDSVIASGEDLSARLVACALRARGRRASVVDAREMIRTDAQFGRARPQLDELRCLARERLLPMLEAGEIPVTQGFVGAAEDGRTTTLGRGGSDYTAALLGAALDAEVVHIWTDVDGILSGDPRSVDRPRILQEVGFEEAVELAYFGAKVIHPGAAKHAVSHGVPLRVRNTFNPDCAGTLILSDRRGVPDIAAVAHKPRVSLIKVRSHPSALQYGFLARVFEVLGRHQVPVDLVATSHSSTAFTIDQSEAIDGLSADLAAFSDVEVINGLATITVVGHGLLVEPGIDALVFWAVERTPVHLISQASDVSLSFLVSDEDAEALVRKLHMTLIELRDEGSREQME